MSEDVEALIRKLVSAFPSPGHLRGNPEGFKAALDVYRRALSRFSPDALERGWQKAAAGSPVWCRPKRSDVVAACASFEPPRKPDEG